MEATMGTLYAHRISCTLESLLCILASCSGVNIEEETISHAVLSVNVCWCTWRCVALRTMGSAGHYCAGRCRTGCRLFLLRARSRETTPGSTDNDWAKLQHDLRRGRSNDKCAGVVGGLSFAHCQAEDLWGRDPLYLLQTATT
jgi:hypothetical protein